MRIKIYFLFAFLIAFSCKEKKSKTAAEEISIEPVSFLPFQKISLKDLSAFQEAAPNWKVVANVSVDRSTDQTMSIKNGKGVLVNLPSKKSRDNLFLNFEHGNIEFEVDFMMPKGSNSGLYFQGRYEIQLFDSWCVEHPKYSDLGGIYQRWDPNRKKGQEGYDGKAPKLNTAKSPGLWQHLKIVFHAPKFDSAGNKIKNARFEKVYLNGVLIQENSDLSGPTRAAAFNDEKPLGPLMIQGDHGPVAFKNINYKKYDDKNISLSNITMSEYENKEVVFPNLDSLVAIRTISTDSISANMVSGDRSQRILKYEGEMSIPESGDYLFDFKVNVGGGLLLIDRDTIVDLNGENNLDSLGLGKVNLKKGKVPFTLLYNKFLPWTKGFSIEVEGPSMQKHALQAASSLNLSKGRPAENIMINIEEEVIAQRSFLMHDGEKRTHCISVGTPQNIHYAYDLEMGSLLKVWNGNFLDATQMWHSRGEKQLGRPAGFVVSFHGSPEFAQLEKENSKWPKNSDENLNRKQLGYEFDENRIPVFSSQVGGSLIFDKMTPSKTLRKLKRTVEINGNEEIWHKVAAGKSIEKLTDGTYIVNDESYFIDFLDSSNLKPFIRKVDEMNELLVKIPSGKQSIEYSITW